MVTAVNAAVRVPPRVWIIRAGGIIIAAALAGNALFAGPWLRALGADAVWFGVAATLVCFFAASLALTRPRQVVTVTFGVYFAAVAFYMLDVTAGHDPRYGFVAVLDRVQMWTTPLLLASWVRAAQMLATRTRNGEGHGEPGR